MAIGKNSCFLLSTIKLNVFDVTAYTSGILLFFFKKKKHFQELKLDKNSNVTNQ